MWYLRMDLRLDSFLEVPLPSGDIASYLNWLTISATTA